MVPSFARPPAAPALTPRPAPPVRCFGSENRGGNVPGTADVYEFITFSGKDILELQVAETAPPAPAPIADPAILSTAVRPRVPRLHFHTHGRAGPTARDRAANGRGISRAGARPRPPSRRPATRQGPQVTQPQPPQ
jgi:hypothetical protein